MNPQRSLPTFDAFEDPGGPDARVMHHIHRGHDGYVVVAQKNDEGHLLSTALRATELAGVFPSMVPQLLLDSYFSVSGYWKAGFGVSKLTQLGLPNANRKKANLQWLTACYVDLDAHNVGKDAADALAAVWRAYEAGDVPPPSLLMNSGRGLWAFWILVDAKDPTHPQRAWPDKVLLYAAVQNRIIELFAHVGADAKAKDACRITRIPGSVNTKANRRVRYMPLVGDDGRLFNYTLNELAEALNVQLKSQRPTTTYSLDAPTKDSTTPSDTNVLKGRRGWKGCWTAYRKNFELLWELRGGFGPGTRNSALYVYSTILRCLHLDETDVQVECYQLFRSFEQIPERYSQAEFDAAMKQERKKGVYPSKQRCADLLDVTPAEAATLSCLPHPWPCAARFAGPVTPVEAEKLSRPQLQARRRALLQSRWVELKGHLPSSRKLVAWLETMGVKSVAKTVLDDLKALRIENTPVRRKKSRKRARSRQPKLFP